MNDLLVMIFSRQNSDCNILKEKRSLGSFVLNSWFDGWKNMKKRIQEASSLGYKWDKSKKKFKNEDEE